MSLSIRNLRTFLNHTIFSNCYTASSHLFCLRFSIPELPYDLVGASPKNTVSIHL
jgi:hypothetical protein